MLKLLALAKAHPIGAAALAGGAAGLVALRRRSSDGTPTSETGEPYGYVLNPGNAGVDTVGADSLLSSVGADVAGLAAQLQAYEEDPPRVPAPTGQTLQAAGFWYPDQPERIVIGSDRGEYQAVGGAYAKSAGYKVANALLSAGETLYFQPNPGMFVAYNPASPPASNTPLFARLR